jgi:hypothetical protein
MASKLRLKLGPIEVEYEGEEEFLKDELPNLLRAVLELQKSAKGLKLEDNAAANGDDENGGGDEKTTTGKVELSTGSVASKLGCKSGPDLVYAACAHLALVKGMAAYPRKEILKEAKTATAFYNKSVSANLTKHLNSLVSTDKLNETSAGVFALQAKALADIKAKLGLSN